MQLGNKRKRKVQAIQETHSGVDHCLCGVHATPNSNDAAKCKRNGCETKWYHLECIQLEQVPKNWVCDACSSSQRGRGGKHARR
ncbi:hypothetical protein M413DRAFT_79336 [Hebeloma cylindrosporum]|uniref:Zinc finger PHD-type domain-containing protein n=1 Tax=Hebeloma cylindrosporum TaxID=76867 RepID=A0A0C3BU06_HEBCY|nr:hypothetical protein M413DRAFT_79976 [Hebeloma cylindrosporum h7]KIM35251.1 hypothetical protein M413DRAFT_79585 [Hebeloma cylindrosporum h7]KIM35512.1 hypothetical protein M413DRAFT_79336 [Hebeloma cylindrosporum h7]